MGVEEKLEQFSKFVFVEAEKHREEVLTRINADYNKAIKECLEKTSTKYNRRFEEETNQAVRKVQKDIVEAQTSLKKELIAKRTEKIDLVFDNVSKRLLQYFDTQTYIKDMVSTINANKVMKSGTIVYVVARDIIHKDFIEKETGAEVVQSEEDFMGGFKITLSDTSIGDFSIKSKYDEEKLRFNKIRI